MATMPMWYQIGTVLIIGIGDMEEVTIISDFIILVIMAVGACLLDGVIHIGDTQVTVGATVQVGAMVVVIRVLVTMVVEAVVIMQPIERHDLL